MKESRSVITNNQNGPDMRPPGLWQGNFLPGAIMQPQLSRKDGTLYIASLRNISIYYLNSKCTGSYGVVVPIVLNLILISMYILIGAILFGFWEGWDLLSAAYFTFVTLTTIGFGDYTPGKSFLNYKDGVSASMTMVATCAYVLLGMALVSMCINLMQEQLIEKVKWFGREIGLIKTPTEEKSRSPSIHSSDTGQKY
ncbi:potassium channel subfamily K member 2-like [Centruroides sculpturatus]|uniref:potassium channel subfamily K member 2-like n=1 Tax=Centruroides sculpturatus TaxID=218467 RepID=UPI000C6D1D95|nr:potassium channel subfamily K member 2-like [Centruroides sculpturatus]